jgi:hypothetical protein
MAHSIKGIAFPGHTIRALTAFKKTRKTARFHTDTTPTHPEKLKISTHTIQFRVILH